MTLEREARKVRETVMLALVAVVSQQPSRERKS